MVVGRAGRGRATAAVVVATSVVTSLLLFGGTSAADSASALLYDYDFTAAGATVANSAATGPATPLHLVGAWTPTSDGVYFNGDTKGTESIGYGLPASGTYTLNAPATQAVGFGARFAFTPPTTGACFPDTPNISQIGRYGSYRTQAKIQISKCADSKTAAFAQCRMAGGATPSSVPPVRSTMPLVGGFSYVITCAKTPDASGRSTVTLSVTKLDPVNGNETVKNVFSVAALGVMRTTQAISVANKYPLPAASANTDQFVGDLNRTVYCVGSVTDVTGCLASYLPAA